MLSRISVLGLALSIVTATAQPAAAALFNFENTPATTGTPGALTSLTLTDSGLSTTITREGGIRFDVQTAPYAPSYGLNALSPFFNTGNTAFIFNFSGALSSATISAGDFGVSDDDVVVFQAYSGLGATGTLLATTSATVPNTGGFTFTTLSVSSASPILSLRVIGGSAAFPNSVFYDNLNTTTFAEIPEPAMGLLGGLVVVGLAGLKFRSSRKAS